MERPLGEESAVTTWLKTFGTVQPFAMTITRFSIALAPFLASLTDK
jgi:hypothetical protein